MFGLIASVAGSLFNSRSAKKAQRRARQDALEDEKRAKMAEVFAETEGQGLGNLGKVKLAVDDEDLNEQTKLRKQGKVKAML
jgi:hypothetical protein